MAVVQSYSLEERCSGGSCQQPRSLPEGVKAKKLAAGLERRTDVLVGIGTGLVLSFGAFRVLAGPAQPGELTVFLIYLKTAFKPLRDIAKYTGRIAKAAASGERIVDVLDKSPRSRTRRTRGRLGDSRARSSSATSRWPTSPATGAAAVSSFYVPAGQRVAIVGPSGAGQVGAGEPALPAARPRRAGGSARRARPAATSRSARCAPRSPSCCRRACCSRSPSRENIALRFAGPGHR